LNQHCTNVPVVPRIECNFVGSLQLASFVSKLLGSNTHNTLELQLHANKGVGINFPEGGGPTEKNTEN